jgi:hypothetical protein
MNISTTDARSLFTKKLVATFTDSHKPKTFGRSFFNETESSSKEISIEVQRNRSLIAVDVVRGSDGNRNTFGSSTEKIFVPPMYDEFFDATELDAYDALYIEKEISPINFGKFLEKAAEKMEVIKDKIERSYEKQTWEVLETGIVTLVNGINIDFKRKAASLVDLGGGAYWTGGSVDPNTALEAGCTFLKETGKMAGSVVNVIMGASAFAAYQNNTIVKARATQVQWGLDKIMPAQAQAVGASYHGYTSVGPYTLHLWSYPDFYETAAGVKTKYVNDKKIIMVPEKPSFVLSYAAVPQLLSTGIAPVKGKFMAYEHIDPRKVAHLMGVKSAGVAIPVGVDEIYTAQVVA